MSGRTVSSTFLKMVQGTAMYITSMVRRFLLSLVIHPALVMRNPMARKTKAVSTAEMEFQSIKECAYPSLVRLA